MGRFHHGVPVLLLLPLAWMCASCGGGSSSTGPPPPPAPDFSLGLSPNSISVPQGGTSSALTLTANPINGFTGTVQVTFSALPAGVTSNPVTPFNVSAGTSTTVFFGAAANAATGNFTVSAQGSSGSLSHSNSLALAIQGGGISSLPRTAFVRTEATSAADDPFGESHHRHIAYDAVNKRVFVANRAINRVEVFSSTSQTRTAQISIPGASSADLSADGSTVWIGTSLEQIVAIDTASLQIKNRYSLAGLTPLPNTIFDRPVEVLSLSSGKALVRLRQPVTSEALLALWDPASNSLIDLTSAAPAVFQQGVGVLARTGDHTKVLAAANDSSGELALFDSTGHVAAGPLTIGSDLITRIAANPDGTRFAALFAPSGNTQILLLDAGLHQVGAYAPALVHGVTSLATGKICMSASPLLPQRSSLFSMATAHKSLALPRTRRFKASPRESKKQTKCNFFLASPTAASASLTLQLPRQFLPPLPLPLLLPACNPLKARVPAELLSSSQARISALLPN